MKLGVIPCLLMALAAPLAAQVRLETGSGQSRLDQLPSSSLTAVSGSITAVLGRTSIDFSGNTADHFGLGFASTANGAAHYHLAAGSWDVAVGAIARTGREIGIPQAASAAGDIRVTRDVGALGLTARWSQGWARVGSAASPWMRPDFTAALKVGAFRVGASWRATLLRDSLAGGGAFGEAPTALHDSLTPSAIRDIQDVGMTMAWHGGPLALDARGGRRFGTGIASQTWWEASAALRITPMMSLVARSGRMASDAVFGLRGGQYNTLGVRVDLQPRGLDARILPATTQLAEVVRETNRRVRVMFVLPAGTRRAALAGDVTSWHSVELSPTSDGRWETTLDAATGIYRINISTDGGPWIVPPGLPASDDGFGSRVGLLVLDR